MTALEKKRLEVEKMAIELNIERYNLRFLELDEEKKRLTENIEVSNKRILEINTQIK